MGDGRYLAGHLGRKATGSGCVTYSPFVRLVLVFLLALASCRSNAPKPGPGGALVMATVDGCPNMILADGDHVYFATKSGTLGRIPKAGGKAEVLHPSLRGPTGMVIGETIYVATAGAIVSVPKTGGASTPVASGLNLVQGLVMDASYLYFADYVKDTSTIARILKTGGNIDRLQSVPGLVSRIGLDDVNLCFVVQHELVRLPKTGGFRSAVGLTVQGDVLRADAKHLYFVDGTSFVRADKATGKTTRLIDFKGSPEPFIDDREVVWNEDRKSIQAVPASGGRAREIANDQPNPRAVTGDDQNVYWVSCAADGEPGTISKKAR
jgi:hypothetical protein